MAVPVLSDALKINLDKAELGKADTLRYNVISFVAEEQYERAVGVLKDFLIEDSEYPGYKERSERYIGHCIDLVNAIKAKKNFPGAQYLTISKQQELTNRFKEHYHELVITLKKVEKIYLEIKLADIRSTVWVLKSLVFSVGIVLLAAFIVELNAGGLFKTGVLVINDALDKTIGFILNR